MWGSCSVSCGARQMTRQRFCVKPMPLYGGKNCTGGSLEHMICQQGPCDGKLLIVSYIQKVHCFVTMFNIAHSKSFMLPSTSSRRNFHEENLTSGFKKGIL